MPVYNQERYLKKSIKSILNQSFTDFEFLILDDGSSDNSLKIAKSFRDKRIKIFKNIKKQGLTRCLNTLINQSRSEYIARMDGDDISFRNRLKEQVSFLDKNKDVVLLGCWAKIIGREEKIIGEFKYPTKYKQIRKVILSFNPFIHSSVMFRKSVFEKIGGYDKNLFYSQDYDLFLRLVNKFKCVNIPKFLLKFRWDPDFNKQKEQHLTALKIRLKALKEYGYNKEEIVNLIKPLFLYFIPIKIKKLYWQKKLKG